MVGALVPWGPAVPNQSQPRQPGRGVNRTHLPAGCLRLCQALSLIITWEKCPLCFPQCPGPGSRRSGRLGLGWRQAAWGWQSTASGWEEGARQGAGLGSSVRAAQRQSHLGLRPRVWRGGVWRWQCAGVGERGVSKSTAETPFEMSSKLPFFGM